MQRCLFLTYLLKLQISSLHLIIGGSDAPSIGHQLPPQRQLILLFKEPRPAPGQDVIVLQAPRAGKLVLGPCPANGSPEAWHEGAFGCSLPEEPQCQCIRRAYNASEVWGFFALSFSFAWAVRAQQRIPTSFPFWTNPAQFESGLLTQLPFQLCLR